MTEIEQYEMIQQIRLQRSDDHEDQRSSIYDMTPSLIVFGGGNPPFKAVVHARLRHFHPSILRHFPHLRDFFIDIVPITRANNVARPMEARWHKVRPDLFDAGRDRSEINQPLRRVVILNTQVYDKRLIGRASTLRLYPGQQFR